LSINANALSQEWGNLVNLSELKSFLSIPVFTTDKDDILQDLIDGISEWAALEAGRPLAKARFTYEFDGSSGWRGSYIMLPQYPVLEIISITEYWGNSGGHPLSEQTPTNQVDGFQCEYRTGRLTRVFQGLIPKPFFPGSRNVTVTWDAGYNPVPPSIRLAVKEAIKWYWDNTQQHSRSRPSDDGWQKPDPSQFWSSVLPAMLGPVLTPFLSVGIG
jgi:hypothetical protein